MKHYRIWILVLSIALLLTSAALAQSTSTLPEGVWEASTETLSQDLWAYGLNGAWSTTDDGYSILHITDENDESLASFETISNENGIVQMYYSERREMLLWLVEYAASVETEVEQAQYFVATPDELSYGYDLVYFGYDGSVSWNAATKEFSLGGGGWSDINGDYGNSLLVLVDDQPYLVISSVAEITRAYALYLAQSAVNGDDVEGMVIFPLS